MPRGGFGTARGAGLTPAKRRFALRADDPLAAKVAAHVRGVAGAVGAAENHSNLQVIRCHSVLPEAEAVPQIGPHAQQHVSTAIAKTYDVVESVSSGSSLAIALPSGNVVANGIRCGYRLAGVVGAT